MPASMTIPNFFAARNLWLSSFPERNLVREPLRKPDVMNNFHPFRGEGIPDEPSLRPIRQPCSALWTLSDTHSVAAIASQILSTAWVSALLPGRWSFTITENTIVLPLDAVR
jgi:hypothetical protein